MTAAKQLLGADAAGITLTDATGALHWASGSDQPAQAVANDRRPAAGPCTEAFTTGRPAVMYDAYQERRRGGPWGEVSLAIAELEPRSALSVPIDLGDGPIGTLDLYATSPRGGITPRSRAELRRGGGGPARHGGQGPHRRPSGRPGPGCLGLGCGCRLGRADGRATPQRPGGVTQLCGPASRRGRELPRTPLDLTDPAHQRTLIDAAVATLPPSRPSPDREVDAGCPIGLHPEHA